MIDIISSYTFEIPYKSRNIVQIEDVNSKVLIIDEELINYEKLNKKIESSKKLYIIVLLKEKKYSSKKIEMFYKHNIDHFIRRDKIDNHLIPLLDLLAKKYHVIDKINKSSSHKLIEIDGNIIRFTKREIQIFEYLLKNIGTLCYRKRILTEVLKYHESADTRIVDVYIKHLRTKLGESSYVIKTERGKGYILNREV